MIENLFLEIETIIKYIMFLIVIFISGYIYVKSIKLYKLSNYEGLKIFGLAFLYFALGFLFSFFIFLIDFLGIDYSINSKINFLYFLFYYFISMAGLMLVYSLVWKDFQNKINSSIGNILTKKYLLLNIIGLIIASVSLFRPVVMFLIMLILLLYSIILSYSNYTQSKLNTKNNFSQIYFITVVLTFLGYLSNFLLGFFPYLKIYVYIATIIVFLSFFYGTLKLEK